MKRVTLRKRTKRPIGKLKRELDRLYSIFIRKKYADKNGMVACFTCGEVRHWRQMQAGHYVSRQYNSVRWDDRNVFPQDISCNIFKKGHLDAYALHLVDTYGPDILKYLAKKKLEIFPLTAKWLEEQIAKYKKYDTQETT